MGSFFRFRLDMPERRDDCMEDDGSIIDLNMAAVVLRNSWISSSQAATGDLTGRDKFTVFESHDDMAVRAEVDRVIHVLGQI